MRFGSRELMNILKSAFKKNTVGRARETNNQVEVALTTLHSSSSYSEKNYAAPNLDADGGAETLLHRTVALTNTAR